MIETKVIQVANDPDVLNRVNEFWGKFGWAVTNVQITHSQDTRTYTSGWDYYTGENTVETTTINYATITYQRDKEMRNYAQLAALQQEYENVISEIDSLEMATKTKYFPGIIQTIILLAIWPMGLLYIAYKIYETVKKAKLKKESASKIERNRARLNEIVQQADMLS